MKPSGKFVLRISSELHSRFKAEARTQNTSLNQVILRRLENSQEAPEILGFMQKVFGNHLLGVVNFGSSVRNERTKNSDIDLLIVLADSQPIERSLYSLWDQKIESKSPYSPQFVHLPKSREISGIWLEVAMEGEIVFDRESIMKTQLRIIREEIASGKYIRKLVHGHPYWIKSNPGRTSNAE